MPSEILPKSSLGFTQLELFGMEPSQQPANAAPIGERRVIDEKLVAAIVDAINKQVHSQTVHRCLSEDEQRWVRLAIEAQARRIRFRDAVIEKSLAGLVWSAIAGFGYLFLDYLKNHGFK